MSIIEDTCSNYKPILGNNITKEGKKVNSIVIGRLCRCAKSTSSSYTGNNCIDCKNFKSKN